MSQPLSRDLRSSFWATALALAVVALTLRAFGPSLGWGFTDADAWSDVAWARHPLSEQLLTKLTGGIAGTYANFWRPAAMLDYWVERRLFGWNAAGWHAWDMGLHVLASLIAGVFVAKQARFDGLPYRAISTLVTLLFAAHPLTEEVVPAVARNLDVLLGIGTFGALAALVAVSRRRRDGGRWIPVFAVFLALVALSLGAKESGVLLAPLTVAWIGLFRSDLPWNRRAREALVLGTPVVALIIVYLMVRAHVLGGVGGYYDNEDVEVGSWVVGAAKRAFIEPFVPSLSVFLNPQKNLVLVLAAALWAVVLVGASRAEHRRAAAFGAFWFILATGLFAVTGTCSRRVYYVPTLAGLLVLGPAILHAWRVRSKVGLALAVLWLATFVHGSPVFARYATWGESASASDLWLRTDRWGTLPRGTVVWLLDRPFRIDLDPRSFRLWGRSSHAHCETSYSLEALLEERYPDLDLRVRTLTGSALRRPVAKQKVDIAIEGETLVVKHTGGERQDWKLKSPFEVERKDATVRVTPKKAGRNLDIIAVWTKDGPVFWEPGAADVSR